MLWTFHNTVNQRLNKPIFSRNDLDQYKRAHLPKTLKYFMYHMYRNYSLNRSFNEQMYRRRVANQLSTFIQSNASMFVRGG